MKKPLIIGLIIIVLLAGIYTLGRLGIGSSKTAGEESTGSYDMSAPDAAAGRDVAVQEAPMEPAPTSNDVLGDKIIRQVDYQVRSKTYDTDLAFFSTLPERFGGAAESIDQGVGYYTEPDQRFYRVVYRIPTDRLNDFMAELEKDRVIYHKSYNQYNITDSYNQTEARLKTLLATQARYLALLERAEAINDIITIEQALTNVSSEIEWLSQQKDSYDKDIDYTSVSLLLTEVSASEALSGRQSFWGELRDAFLSGIATFVEGIKQLLILILRLWPLLILVAIGVAVYIVRFKQHKPKE